MLSRSGIYALQAALHLAQHAGDRPVSAARMAEALEVPRDYLAKVLRRLSKDGLLDSTRGVRGGYRLSASPGELTVDRVVRAFDDVQTPRQCLLGGPCHSDRPCPAHLRRLEWNEARSRILAETKLTDLLPDGTGDRDGVDSPIQLSTNKRK
ncbi:MAG: Rrf2 family transcriptional regulator [Longimicrobiales bacterium]|nr:Rrf2 family transcriptional regulator [Longimicrobiales bacterium]